jgi:two-component system, NarL family, nitrate/nitrite response regulator NarL
MRILLVAEPGLLADGVARSLAQIGRDVQVTVCEPDRALDRNLEPQLIVLDVDTTAQRAPMLIAHFKERFPCAPVVALAGDMEEPSFSTLMEAGITAYLPKTYREPQCLTMLREVLRETQRQSTAALGQNTDRAGSLAMFVTGKNAYGLTEAELETLSLLCQGLTNLDIAKARQCMEGTVKAHLHKIYRKLSVANRSQAIKVGQHLDEVRQIDKRRAGEQVSLRYWLLPHMKPESKRQGELLFTKGDPGQTMYFIQKGRVALPEIGVEMTEGDLFGEIGIFTPEQTRTCTARCETDARLFSLTADQAERLFFEYPQFAYYITRLIAGRLRADSKRLR